MSQPYLFYSERCPHSKQIIETLKALNKASLYKFILVENLPRNQIPAFLKAVPTIYNPETKEAVTGKDIYGFIAKPTNARKEIPEKAGSVQASGQQGAPQQYGELSPWGFEGSGRMTESYSSWDAPTSFVSDGNSMYTFLGGGPAVPATRGAAMPAANGPDTENTIKSKTGSNDDVKRRMESMQKQRESEFSAPERT